MVVATICAIIGVSGIAQGESSTVVGTLVPALQLSRWVLF